MIKACYICGKPFEAKQSNYIACSDACRLKRRTEMQATYQKARFKYSVNHSNAICRLCGKQMNNRFGARKRMHDECVFQDCVKTLEKGMYLNKAQTERLVQRGYSISEFKEDFL